MEDPPTPTPHPQKKAASEGYNLDKKETDKRRGDQMQFVILDGVLGQTINKN